MSTDGSPGASVPELGSPQAKVKVKKESYQSDQSDDSASASSAPASPSSGASVSSRNGDSSTKPKPPEGVSSNISGQLVPSQDQRAMVSIPSDDINVLIAALGVDTKYMESVVHKFSGKRDDWIAWKRRLLDFAESRSKLAHFERDVTRGLLDDHRVVIQDKTVLGSLRLLQKDIQVRAKIQQCKSVFSAWQMLVKYFESRQEETVLRLQAKFHIMKMRSGDNITDKCNEMGEMREELKNAGHPMNESLFISGLLQALPNSRNWETFKTVTRGKIEIYKAMDKPFDAQMMVDFIREECDRSDPHMDSGSDSDSDASDEEDRHKRKRSTKKRVNAIAMHVTVDKSKKSKCAICGRDNHDTSKCRDKFKKRTYARDNNLCFTCHLPGHTQQTCPDKKSNGANRTPVSASSSSASIQTTLAYTCPVTEPSSKDNAKIGLFAMGTTGLFDQTIGDTWLIDSAASRHITNNLTVFRGQPRATALPIELPDGSFVTATMVRDVDLVMTLGGTRCTKTLHDVIY